MNRQILTAFMLAAAAWMFAAPSPAQHSPQASPHGQLVPYVCDLTKPNDVYSRYVNTPGHLTLNIFAGQEDAQDNAGATVDGIDGVHFNRLDFDFSGVCDGTFVVTYFGQSNVQGISVGCTQAIQTNHGTHLTYTPDMFGVPKGDKIIQFCISQFTTDKSPRSDLIKNVQVNGVLMAPSTKITAGCQFTTE